MGRYRRQASSASFAGCLAGTVYCGWKVRCFSAQPYPPYEVGDLWVQGGSGDILCCQHDRESGSYVASDWVRASKYTDDTKAIEAGKTATDYIKDGADGVQVGLMEVVM